MTPNLKLNSFAISFMDDTKIDRSFMKYVDQMKEAEAKILTEAANNPGCLCVLKLEMVGEVEPNFSTMSTVVAVADEHGRLGYYRGMGNLNNEQCTKIGMNIVEQQQKEHYEAQR